MAQSRLVSPKTYVLGEKIGITLNVDNNNYTHKVEVYVAGQVWLSKSGIGYQTGTYLVPTTAQITNACNLINGVEGVGWYQHKTVLKLTTYNGSTSLGTTSYDFYLRNPARYSDFDFENDIVIAPNKGVTYVITPSIKDTNLKFTIGLAIGGTTESSHFYTLETKIASCDKTKTFTTAELNTIYDKFHAFNSSNSDVGGYFQVTGYYNNVKLCEFGYSVDFDVSSATPKFASTSTTYTDSNTTTKGITGNGAYIIQNKSTLQVNLPASSLASGRCGGSISTYECTCANRTVSASSTGSALTFNLGTINASANTTMKITATDNRGNKASITKTIQIVPYSPPTIVLTAKRPEAFSESMQLSVSGKFSNLPVAGVPKGTISSVSFYVKLNNGSFSLFSGTVNTNISNANGTYTATGSQSLSISDIASVYVIAKDNMNTSVQSATVEIPNGIPIFFIDSKLGSMGALTVPKYSSVLDSGMRIIAPQNQYWNLSTKTYGLDMNNSDIIGANAIVFSDKCNQIGEGLIFLNEGGAGAKTVDPDYNYNATFKDDVGTKATQFDMRNDAIYINNKKAIQFANFIDGSMDYGFRGRSFVFQTSYDISQDDEYAYEGFCVKNGEGTAIRMDANEIFCQKADKTFENIGINAGHIGLYAWSGSCRLQFCTDVANTWGNWQGLTLEQMTYDSTTNALVTTGNSLKMDANEIVASSSNNQLNTLYVNAKTIELTAHQTKTNPADTKYVLKLSHDSNTAGGFMQYAPAYTRTATGTANMLISSAGTIMRSSSSAKAKLDIVPAFDSLDEYKQILNIEPVKWFDKNACEVNADVMTAELNGEEFECADIPNLNRVYGCVAEQLKEVGLDCLVEYDNENEEIAGVAYDRIPIMYIPLIKDLYAQIEDLKQEIETLKTN